MKKNLDFRPHAARGIMVLAVLTVYRSPVPQSKSMLLPAAQARTESPGITGAASVPAPPDASVMPPEPPAIPLADPFAATSWAPPELPSGPSVPAPAQSAEGPAKAADPAPPAAPPLPFVYVGRYVEGSRQMVMLMRGEQLLLLQQGDTVDNTYKVERIANDRIELTYLPLGTRQSVHTTDSA